jgi:predicted ribosomally synthesized peptide with SipW-like signal peptide
MKKIIISLCIISAVAAVTVSTTRSYFSDTETSTNNIIQTGTVDINIDGQNPWTGKFDWANMQPGDTKEFTFNIKNVGTYPVRVWQILKNITTAENGITEPERAWYDAHGEVAKNDLDTAFDIEMNINGNMVVNKEAGFSLSEVKDYYLNLMKLDYKLWSINIILILLKLATGLRATK